MLLEMKMILSQRYRTLYVVAALLFLHMLKSAASLDPCMHQTIFGVDLLIDIAILNSSLFVTNKFVQC